jgi:hypothetical protein
LNGVAAGSGVGAGDADTVEPLVVAAVCAKAEQARVTKSAKAMIAGFMISLEILNYVRIFGGPLGAIRSPGLHQLTLMLLRFQKKTSSLDVSSFRTRLVLPNPTQKPFPLRCYSNGRSSLYMFSVII